VDPDPSDRHHEGAEPPNRFAALATGAVVLVAITAGAVWLLAARKQSALAAEGKERTTANAAGVVVRTTRVIQSPAVRSVELLGEAKPFATVTLYAKVAGYLKTMTVDVGDRVASGATIATIESPETDRALASAKADFDNKQLTSSRVSQLLAKKLVSPQETDQAKTEATMANERLEGLREQQGYETLRAPFAGRITARFADPGALVQSAASSQTSALPVVTVSQVDRLRVFAYLDQADASIAHTGTRATIALPDRPNDHMPAEISRVSGELDPKTRKMLTELDIENANNAIVPGSFVQVRIDFPQATLPQAPVEALLVRGGKTYVAVIDAQSRVHLTPVVVARNDGTAITFASGVAAGDNVALNLGSAITDGEKIQADTAKASGVKK
jgi:RND family efflux transporter MFP subunit